LKNTLKIHRTWFSVIKKTTSLGAEYAMIQLQFD